ncbi:hypothetical protein DITRI_Ditri16bG0032500 [Diplodiscus trichospermus]
MHKCAVFLLAVIACSHLVFSVEGRQINSVRKFDSKQSNQVDNSAKMQKEDDHQPGANHSLSASEKKEVLPVATPTKTSSFGASVAGYKDGFRPTKSGNSPGVGHYFTDNEEDTEQKSESISRSNDKHLTAGGKEDFGSPTIKPGHSPGVGHAFPSKNSKPNA